MTTTTPPRPRNAESSPRAGNFPAIQWAHIPAGSFWMGGIDEDKFVTAVELPRHEVTLSEPFSISRHPMTNRQWQSLIGELPAAAVGNSPLAPVVGVTWLEAERFCQKLTSQTGRPHRLPTEAEWEYVCRAGSHSVFPHGNHLTPDQANYLYDEMGRKVGIGRPSDVGSYGDNPFGIADLSGNVCEWTADHWHPDFHNAPADGSAWIDTFNPSPRRVIRGGAWDHLPRVLRSSWRDWALQTVRWDNLGFRIVTEAETP